jgi:radical SAM superfamily enzyme
MRVIVEQLVVWRMNCLNGFAMLASTISQWMEIQKKEKAHKIALKMGISERDGPYGKGRCYYRCQFLREVA